MKLLLCTLNENKIKEIKEAFKNLPVNIITLFDLNDNEEVIENGLTLKENAFIKAEHFAKKYNMSTIADDTGLLVDFLGGLPGVHTNRYEKTVELRNKKLLKELKDANNRSAHFETIICLYNYKTKKPYYFKGVVKGTITHEAKGSLGFGYDPIFYIEEKKKTMAELTVKEKNEISHRGKAIKLLQEFLNENINNI